MGHAALLMLIDPDALRIWTSVVQPFQGTKQLILDVLAYARAIEAQQSDEAAHCGYCTRTRTRRMADDPFIDRLVLHVVPPCCEANEPI